MMQEHNSDDNLPWPGFVDIISSVLLLFIFFVMMMIIIIIFSSRNDGDGETEGADAQTVDLDKTRQQDIERLSRDEDDSKTKVDTDITDLTFKHLNPDYKEVSEQSFRIEEDEDGNEVFYVMFKAREINVNQVISNALYVFAALPQESKSISPQENTTANASSETALPENLEPDKNAIFIVSAPDIPSNAGRSLNRNTSLARGLNVRNVLLKSGIESKEITIKYTIPVLVEDDYNWISITKTKKEKE